MTQAPSALAAFPSYTPTQQLAYRRK